MTGKNKRPVPVGIDDFKILRQQDYYFVDKSLLIKDILDTQFQAYLFTRPRRFGKTINMSMLRYFFDCSDKDNADLFKDLQIKSAGERYWQAQGKYPVLFLTLKNLKARDWQTMERDIHGLMADLYGQHRYLIETDILTAEQKTTFESVINKSASSTVVRTSLATLSRYLHSYYGERVIILVDEYDTPIYYAFSANFIEPLLDLLSTMLGSALKGNESLKFGIVTGILQIAKESFFSGLNNFISFNVTDKMFNQYFGLHGKEVTALLQYYGHEAQHEKLRDWYNGYCFDNLDGIYNPWSLLNFISKGGTFGPYWVNTGNPQIINRAMAASHKAIKEDLERLLRGEVIEQHIDETVTLQDLSYRPDAIWCVLLFSGYLTIASSVNMDKYCLRIPNLEIRRALENLVSSWFTECLGPSYLTEIWELLTKGDVDGFRRTFTDYVESALSYFDVGGKEPERFYHALVLGMLVQLKESYQIQSNRESGYGRYDVMLVPDNNKNLGVIIEFKKVSTSVGDTLDSAVKDAFEQISERQYQQTLKTKGIERILALAIAFEGKQVLIKEQWL